MGNKCDMDEGKRAVPYSKGQRLTRVFTGTAGGCGVQVLVGSKCDVDEGKRAAPYSKGQRPLRMETSTAGGLRGAVAGGQQVRHGRGRERGALQQGPKATTEVFSGRAGGCGVQVLVGNKCDMDEGKRAVPYSKGQALADEFGIQFFETSAKSNVNVDEVRLRSPRLRVAMKICGRAHGSLAFVLILCSAHYEVQLGCNAELLPRLGMLAVPKV